ncbi:hypothetical protein F4780DRAFT_624145 [Xylariomycetidae sp. FL0641]|nr:hypothetical protein F4780DRAFT_624145 [Xylariomycetidae sp. FL0641]
MPLRYLPTVPTGPLPRLIKYLSFSLLSSLFSRSLSFSPPSLAKSSTALPRVQHHIIPYLTETCLPGRDTRHETCRPIARGTSPRRLAKINLRVALWQTALFQPITATTVVMKSICRVYNTIRLSLEDWKVYSADPLHHITARRISELTYGRRKAASTYLYSTVPPAWKSAGTPHARMHGTRAGQPCQTSWFPFFSSCSVRRR